MNKIKEIFGQIIGWIVVGFFIVIGLYGSGNSGGSWSGADYSDSYNDSYDAQKTVDRYDALSDNWDDIKDYLDGTYTVEACSDNSGNCYTLDADISSGDIETLYFPNGGYVNIGAEVNSDGEADGYDDSDDGDYWTFQVDESDIDEALEEWADYEGITLE